MSLPLELVAAPEETTVVGDIDAFMVYVESGQAYQDWQRLQAPLRHEIRPVETTRERHHPHRYAQRYPQAIGLPDVWFLTALY